MSIGFTQIPKQLRVPLTLNEFNNNLAGNSTDIKRALLFAPTDAQGVARIHTPVLLLNTEDAKKQLGSTSVGYAMAEAFLTRNTSVELYAMPLDAAGTAVKASGTITITNAATADGELIITIAQTSVRIACKTSDTIETIAKKLADAITAAAQNIVSVTVKAAVITITALDTGAQGNAINVEHTSAPTGLTTKITALRGGHGMAPVANAIAALPDECYQWFILPDSEHENMLAISDELNSRYDAMRAIGGRAIVAKRGSVAELKSWVDQYNSAHIAVIPVQTTATDADHIWSAACAGVITKQLAIDPSSSLANCAVNGLRAPQSYSTQERNTLLFSGVSSWTTQADGTVQLERVVTTYTQDTNGNPDSSYIDIQTPETLDAMRQIFCAKLAKVYGRDKFGTDNDAKRVKNGIVTPSLVRGFCLELYESEFMRERGWCIDYEQYKDTLRVELDAQGMLVIYDEPTLIARFNGAKKLSAFHV